MTQVEEQKLGIPKLPKLTIDCENERSQCLELVREPYSCKNKSMYLVVYKKPHKRLFAIYIEVTMGEGDLRSVCPKGAS